MDRLNQILKMLQTHPDDTFLHYASAIEYEKLGDYNQAREVLEGLIKIQPNYLPTYYRLGQIYEQLNENELAIDMYKDGKKLARKINDFKTEGELSEALMLLDVFDE